MGLGYWRKHFSNRLGSSEGVIHMPRGGKREGAGRKPDTGETRKLRSLRADEKEWTFILKFARLLKKGNRADCEKFLSQFD